MIIDFHTHIFPSFFRNERNLLFDEEQAFQLLYESAKAKLVGKKELIRNMDEEGVHKSVVFGFPWKNIDNFRRHNDYIIESVHHYPDRLIGFCCFSPLSPHATEEAKRCLESGLSGIGELAVYNSGLLSKEVSISRDIMDICTYYDVPLMLHTNEPVGHQYPGKTPINLGEIYGFVKKYPSNRIVLAHWGGGLFFYMLMKREVRKVLRNVWFDTAASPFLYDPDIYRLGGEIIGFDRFTSPNELKE